MAVYHWIYGTATLRGDQGDFRIRMCGEGLRAYTDVLTELSRRLLAVDYRAGRRDQQCWFAGRLDRKLYVVAVGGGQAALLGAERPLKGGFRDQFSVFACGFESREDLAQYKALIDARDTALFEPLKTYTWELSNGQQPPLWPGRRAREQKRFCGRPKDRLVNIFPADPAQDAALWGNSLLRPAALDLLSPLEARKLIDLLPNAAVTVAGETQPSFYAPSGFADPSLLAARQVKEAAQQAEADSRKTAAETPCQDGGPSSQAESPLLQETEETPAPKHFLSQCFSKFTGFLAPSPSPAAPITSSAEDVNTLHQRWDSVDRTAAMYKDRLDSSQVETVERLLEKLYFKNVRAICPIDLVRDWCWVRLWLGGRQGIPENELNNVLEKFIRQVIRKALYDTFEVEELVKYCEAVIRAASKHEQKDGEA